MNNLNLSDSEEKVKETTLTVEKMITRTGLYLGITWNNQALAFTTTDKKDIDKMIQLLIEVSNELK